ncbi:Signal recognition particle 54 kDa protein [Seminavis robusta]|uniref:signal-recognition-particle GTPase n=1 Tax=Seminavis robusta TaxID=568900 RepID=A0A9N8D7N6_9STRA|nr:Signal recognition particle 54 kDa protein [Seminavis robusta]|eukprot:Sro9_g007060.1 Signal recognition particle 54 kDa protein (593) ;mRNA; r:38063-39934
MKSPVALLVGLLWMWSWSATNGVYAFSLCSSSSSSFLSPYASVSQSHSKSPSRCGSGSGSGTQLNMMFDQLTEAISSIAKQLGPKQKITEASVKPALRGVRRALLDADVNVNVADTLIDGVKSRSLGKEVMEGVTAEQQFIKAMYDELLDMMGGDSATAKSTQQTYKPAATLAFTKDKPTVVLLAGLQGAGKTTAAGKLALYLKEREVDYDAVNPEDDQETQLASKLPKRQRKVLLVAADVYRPAAIKQLEILGESIQVDVFSKGTDANPVDIAREALQKAANEGYDTVLVDTAGRQIIDKDLMTELKRIKETVKPDETLLVVDAMTGQEAASLTAAFDSAVGITGAILTKMDGDSRGGAAVSVRGVSGKPIKFVGTGEKTADLEPFYPDRMASRILGMGDVVSLVEKAAAEVSDKEAAEMQKKMLEARFDFDDFVKQSKLVSKMGNLAGVAKMMPGMAGQLNMNKMREVEARLKKNEAMINSMTKTERAEPELLINHPTARSRITRITKGSGNDFEDGLQFMSEFQRMRTMMSRMQKQMGGPEAMEAAMAGGGGGAPPDMQDMAAMSGNRASRRAAKKNKKRGRGGGGGFG